VKREQETIDLRAQKMMKGRVEPFVVPIVVSAVPRVVQAIRQIAIGAKGKDTINDISIGETTEGA
jgi:hypothetical protein